MDTCYGIDALDVYKSQNGEWHASEGYDIAYDWDILNQEYNSLTPEEAIKLADDKIKMYEEFKADAVKVLNRLTEGATK